MFARNVALRLRPNNLNQFKRVFDAEIIPLLRKQRGCKDVITFALTGGADITAISLWETREDAEAYNTTGYPEVMKKLGQPFWGGGRRLEERERERGGGGRGVG